MNFCQFSLLLIFYFLKNCYAFSSFFRLLTLYNVSLRYVSPEGLGMPSHVLDFVMSKGIPQQVMSTLEESLPDSDVVYMTRIQKERFSTPEAYEKVV